MDYIIVDTTDGKYRGHHLMLERIPVRGDRFTVVDFTYEVVKVSFAGQDISVQGSNYVTIIAEVS
jgi:hypothetical protein